MSSSLVLLQDIFLAECHLIFNGQSGQTGIDGVNVGLAYDVMTLKRFQYYRSGEFLITNFK